MTDKNSLHVKVMGACGLLTYERFDIALHSNRLMHKKLITLIYSFNCSKPDKRIKGTKRKTNCFKRRNQSIENDSTVTFFSK